MPSNGGLPSVCFKKSPAKKEKEKKKPHKAVSLSFNGLNKPSLLICWESERQKKDERKWNESTFGFHFIWGKVRRRERKSITGHTWILFPVLSFSATSHSRKKKKKIGKKTKLLSKLIACRSRAGIKENNQGWWD